MTTGKIKVAKIAAFTGHRDCVYTLEKSDQIHSFFSAAGDGLVVRWDLRNPDQGELVAQIPSSVYAIHFQPEANQLWIGQNFEGVHVIDLTSKKELKSIKITSSAIFDIKIADNDAFIATGDGTVIVLDIADLTVRKHIRTSDKSARCLAINPIMRELAVGYSDNFIRVFSLDDCHLKYAFEAHSNSIFALVYSPDYRLLLSAGRDAHLKVWDATEQYASTQSVVAHMFAINHITYSPDGTLLATCSMDKSIKIWDAATFRLLKVIDRARHAGHGTSINKLYWSQHSNLLVSASDDKTLSVWDLTFELNNNITY